PEYRLKQTIRPDLGRFTCPDSYAAGAEKDDPTSLPPTLLTLWYARRGTSRWLSEMAETLPGTCWGEAWDGLSPSEKAYDLEIASLG
ncbi:hypothetical protein JCM8547_006041, partial [Rhodosporidiobolus lusitaniae]